MRAMVVYDSQFGNTKKVAEAIGEALGERAEVTVVHANEAKPGQLDGLDLLVVGSPTQKFSPTAAPTRFLKAIPAGGLKGIKVAAFDTRATEADIEKVRILSFMVRLLGYAAEPIAKRLVNKAGKQAIAPAGFYVLGMEGPLQEGELERAAGWARQLLAAV